MFKNVASQYAFVYAHNIINDAPATGLTGAALVVYITKDNGAATESNTTSTGDATEIDATNSPGWYRLDLTQAETNTDVLLIAGKSGTAGVEVKGQVIYTQTVMRGTDSAATAVNLAIAQADLDKITGTDGATLATAQGNYTPSKAGDNMNLADDAIKAAKFDQSTAHPVESADTGSSKIARTGADSDTLETISDEVASIEAVTTLFNFNGNAVDANLKQIDEQATNGNNATLKLKTLSVITGVGDAVTITSTDANAIDINGGPLAAGVHISGGASSPAGLVVSGGDAGIKAIGAKGVDIAEIDSILEDTGTTLPAQIANIPTNAGSPSMED